MANAEVVAAFEKQLNDRYAACTAAVIATEAQLNDEGPIESNPKYIKALQQLNRVHPNGSLPGYLGSGESQD